MDPGKLIVLTAIAKDDFATPLLYERELNALIDDGLVRVGGVTKWLVSDAGRAVLGSDVAH